MRSPSRTVETRPASSNQQGANRQKEREREREIVREQEIHREGKIGGNTPFLSSNLFHFDRPFGIHPTSSMRDACRNPRMVVFGWMSSTHSTYIMANFSNFAIVNGRPSRVLWMDEILHRPEPLEGFDSPCKYLVSKLRGLGFRPATC